MASSPSAKINVMLAVPEKKTTSVDLCKPLRQYLVHHFSEREALDNEEDLQFVQQMRGEIEKNSESLDARRDLLQRYFRALCVTESRFPISNESQHVNTLFFTWFDAFKQGKKATQQNIHFEKASIIFNLASVHSQIAFNADRSTPNGIKQACNGFQAAAGAFAFLRDNISMKASGGSSTVDISMESAGMLERLMLAQAQECFFEKAVADQKPSLLCGKIARQVGLYYEEAHAALMLAPLHQHFDRSWAAHLQFKAAQFHGEACYRVALELHEKENIAEEIARLNVALNALATAKKLGRGVSPLLDAVGKLEANVNLNLERAKKENDRVYFMRIPQTNSLAPLPAASLVKPTNLVEVLDASREKLFVGLVPDSCAKALSRYTAMVDERIRMQAEKLQQESEITRVKLKEMELPESLHALEGDAALPEKLRNDVESIQLDGGLSGLEALMGQLQDLRRVNKELLVQAEELLHKESGEDAQFRAQFGTRWARQQSSGLTKSFQDRLNNFHVKLKQAADMDAKLDRTMKDNWTLMSILDVKPIEGALPTLDRPMMSLNGDEDAVVGALKQSLGQLEALGSQRAGLEDMLKEMKQKDNILPKLMSTSGSYEDLFKKEIGKYDQICEEVSRNVEAQERLLQQIKIQNDAFAAVFNLEDFKASRDRAFKQISAAVSKYQEIRDNVNNAGINFYVSLQDAINNLKQQCSDYVMNRAIQSRDMIEGLQRHLAGFSFRDGNSSMKYPPVNPPQRAASRVPVQNAPPFVYCPSDTAQCYMAQPPIPPQNTVGQMPPPPYHLSPGQNMGAAPYHSQGRSFPPVANHNYGQPPYPGWQGPYYNSTAMNLYAGSSQAPHSYQAPPGGTYYPQSQGDDHK